MAMKLALSPGRVFSGAAGNGPRRLAWIGTGAAGILVVIAGFLLAGHELQQTTTVTRLAAADPLPGGSKGSPYFHELARAKAKDDGQAALAAGDSYVAPLEGIAAPEPSPRQMLAIADPIIPVPKPLPPNAPGQAMAASSTQANPFAPTTGAVHRVSDNGGDPPKVDPQQVQAYQLAMERLFNGMGGKAADTQHWSKEETQAQTGGQAGTRADDIGRAQNASTGTQGVTPPLARRRVGKMLMSADRGVYAINKLAVNSDGGGPVIIEAESGPIAGDRMKGGFEQKGDRLVVMLTTLTHEGQDIPIQAIVVTPDTMETTVASRVEEHYIERFALPAAAAFVSGLGQAELQSNTSSVLSPFGGASGFTRLNLPQQLGVAAGAAGAQIGQTLQQSVPKKATVYLDANTPVGVVFLSTVNEPE